MEFKPDPRVEYENDRDRKAYEEQAKDAAEKAREEEMMQQARNLMKKEERIKQRQARNAKMDEDGD